jgi:3-isopropylmalate/(R)-2-methylmalate dehydratase small subunit
MEDSKRSRVTGTAIPIPGNDTDTDRIIPARYMKCVTFDGLEKYAFYDERFHEDGSEKAHPFNESKYEGGCIFIVNKNFGCGSSREHAPQALVRFGMRGIIGESYAEIFSGNCTALGVPAVTAGQADVEKIMAMVQDQPQTEIRIDLETKTVIYGEATAAIDMPEAYRMSLVEGSWDTTAQLLANESEIHKTAAEIPYLNLV